VKSTAHTQNGLAHRLTGWSNSLPLSVLMSVSSLYDERSLLQRNGQLNARLKWKLKEKRVRRCVMYWPSIQSMRQTLPSWPLPPSEQGEIMRELDPETWLMIGVAWVHGLLVGWAIWRQKTKYKTEDEE
jgi:hypothetical protein